MDRVLRRIGTTLILSGVIVLPVLYYAIGKLLRREEACAEADASIVSQCIGDVVFWKNAAIFCFAAVLALAFIGVIIDRIGRLRRGPGRPSR